jgi:hypothetical protein
MNRLLMICLVILVMAVAFGGCANMRMHRSGGGVDVGNLQIEKKKKKKCDPRYEKCTKSYQYK